MSDELRRQIAEMLPRLRRFGYAVSGSPDEAEDLAQAACLRALDRLDQFRPGTRLDSWLFRIVQTIWIDRMRAQRRRPQAGEDALEMMSDEGAGQRRAEARIELARLREHVADLPPEQRAVLALVAIEGLSYREAADVLEIPIGTVMSRLGRARRRLLERRAGEEGTAG